MSSLLIFSSPVTYPTLPISKRLLTDKTGFPRPLVACQLQCVDRELWWGATHIHSSTEENDRSVSLAIRQQSFEVMPLHRPWSAITQGTYFQVVEPDFMETESILRHYLWNSAVLSATHSSNVSGHGSRLLRTLDSNAQRTDSSSLPLDGYYVGLSIKMACAVDFDANSLNCDAQ